MIFLGIDIGSLYIGMAALDEGGTLLARGYERHRGEPAAALAARLAAAGLEGDVVIARTGSGAESVALPGPCFDAVLANAAGARALVPDARNVLNIGGGSFSLVELDARGDYRRSTANSACASGTGAFLDQQAHRLQLDPAALSRRAHRYRGTPPAVATRCAVFAKSDMIHLQQDGHTLDAIAAGLCVGLGTSTVDVLLSGRRLTGRTVLIGGVARNPVVADTVRRKLGVDLVVPAHPELVGALGAAHLVRRPETCATVLSIETLRATLASGPSGPAGVPRARLRAALQPRSESAAAPAWHTAWTDAEGNEAALACPPGARIRGVLGLDVGSTSTKAVLLDESRRVIGWVYRKTAGDPVRAVQRIFDAMRRMPQRGGFEMTIRGVGVTGSGRKLVARIVGADLDLNEITAHARAARFLDPEVDTILEIGGQDAKFTQLQNGMVYHSVMNYVCAAGTGSFIEEQAHKLGVPLAEFAALALGREAPLTSDRCTVFMERDIDLLLRRGWDKGQVAASVLHSVRDNYLNKVVSGLHIGARVCFQGATARNSALVAAFEAGLGRPVQVSPFCHVTGALGMALLVLERIPPPRRSARFKGLDFADAVVSIERETCTLCRNACSLAKISDGTSSLLWGMKCGRDEGGRATAHPQLPAYAFWRRRNALPHDAFIAPTPDADAGGRNGANEPGATSAHRWRVGLPRALGLYGYAPYWRTLLRALNCEPVTPAGSDETVLKRGREIATAEYCAPVFMACGQARRLLEDPAVDFVLIPHLIDAPRRRGFTNAYFCGYVQSHPAMLRSLETLPRADRILAPVVSFSAPARRRLAHLHAALAEPLGVTTAQIRQAMRRADRAQAADAHSALRLGREALAYAERENRPGLVMIGRPYNTADAGLTLDLPRKIAALGYPVILMDMWPADPDAPRARFSNMYWHYGQRILAAAMGLARDRRWFPVYCTHFMCGPDSYLLSYFKSIMENAGKPYLCLQFDGHGADAGYMTRVEAALETFHHWSGIPRPPDAAGDRAGAP